MSGSGGYDIRHSMRPVFAIGLLLAALAIAMPGATPAAMAGNGPGPAFGFAPAGPAMRVQQGLVPLDRVLPVVQRAVPGRILDVQVVGSAYRVKVLTANGRVAHVLVDGRSGQIMRVE